MLHSKRRVPTLTLHTFQVELPFLVHRLIKEGGEPLVRSLDQLSIHHMALYTNEAETLECLTQGTDEAASAIRVGPTAMSEGTD